MGMSTFTILNMDTPLDGGHIVGTDRCIIDEITSFRISSGAKPVWATGYETATDMLPRPTLVAFVEVYRVSRLECERSGPYQLRHKNEIYQSTRSPKIEAIPHGENRLLFTII